MIAKWLSDVPLEFQRGPLGTYHLLEPGILAVHYIGEASPELLQAHLEFEQRFQCYLRHHAYTFLPIFDLSAMRVSFLLNQPLPRSDHAALSVIVQGFCVQQSPRMLFLLRWLYPGLSVKSYSDASAAYAAAQQHKAMLGLQLDQERILQNIVPLANHCFRALHHEYQHDFFQVRADLFLLRIQGSLCLEAVDSLYDSLKEIYEKAREAYPDVMLIVSMHGYRPGGQFIDALRQFAQRHREGRVYYERCILVFDSVTMRGTWRLFKVLSALDISMVGFAPDESSAFADLQAWKQMREMPVAHLTKPSWFKRRELKRNLVQQQQRLQYFYEQQQRGLSHLEKMVNHMLGDLAFAPLPHDEPSNPDLPPDFSPVVDTLYLLQHDFRALLDDLNTEIQACREIEYEAWRAHNIKSRFLANVSEELRFPLQSIVEDTQRLLQQIELHPSEFEQILGHAHQVHDLIAHSLDLHVLEQELSPLALSQTAIQPLLRALDRDFQALAKVSFKQDESSPLFWETDAERLFQILTNLLYQILQLIPHGKIEVSSYGKSELQVIRLVGFSSEPYLFQKNLRLTLTQQLCTELGLVLETLVEPRQLQFEIVYTRR